MKSHRSQDALEPCSERVADCSVGEQQNAVGEWITTVLGGSRMLGTWITAVLGSSRMLWGVDDHSVGGQQEAEVSG